MRQQKPTAARQSGRRRRLVGSLALVMLAGVLAGAALLYGIERVGRTPRELAPYIVRRASGHRSAITVTAGLVSGALIAADGLAPPPGPRLPVWWGASPARSTPPPPAGAQTHLIGSVGELRAALQSASPGDIIELLPGTYRISYPSIGLTAAGTAAAPITLRAPRLGDVILESDTVVAFKPTAPYWHIENLVIRGKCGDDSDCEHAFQVVSGARHIVIRNNLLEDFNAQIKINAEGDQIPDDGTIIGNTLIDTRPRNTANPVTPIDLVQASHWRIADNLIADFTKTEGNSVSYGAFVKGGGSGNEFARNIVLCSGNLPSPGGQQIGLSFGGGGTGATIFRHGDRSGIEQHGSVMRDNLIAFCSDVGIYLNRAANSFITHNTLLDTVGIDVRFIESSAHIHDNLVDGIIRSRDGGVVDAQRNETSPLLGLFVGWHPVRRRFMDAERLDLRWRDPPPRGPTEGSAPDLCGATRPPDPRPGAFEDFSACTR
ncbi:MAG: hypothetical protein KGJ41_08635 [Rhodospirillales bacterium]|nr:hypothetical protein [Rhodospirillales bacterium]MDE2199076.1 hypothetical protein [Rhodospirillales bacterium]MDE2574914.1 hypothetical protein [Rhodospirillales bacterium]